MGNLGLPGSCSLETGPGTAEARPGGWKWAGAGPCGPQGALAVPPLPCCPQYSAFGGRLWSPLGQKPPPQKDLCKTCGILPLPATSTQPWCGFQQKPRREYPRTRQPPSCCSPLTASPLGRSSPRAAQGKHVESQSGLITIGGTKALDQSLKLPRDYEKQQGGDRCCWLHCHCFIGGAGVFQSPVGQ